MRKTTVCLAALSLLLTGFVIAQVTSIPSSTPFRITTTTDGKVIAVDPPQPAQQVKLADDVALRIEGTHDGVIVGTLVAKVNGKWVDVHLASKNMRLGN